MPYLVPSSLSLFRRGMWASVLGVSLIVLASVEAESEEFSDLKQMAEKGDSEAQYKLGVLYENGEGVPQDHADAFKWYRVSAEAGFEKSRRKLRRAAEDGVMEAQYNLGKMNLERQGVSLVDPKSAVKWIEKAAEQGLAEAQNDLGVMYRDGIGVYQSRSEAVRWFRRAVVPENPRTLIALHLMKMNDALLGREILLEHHSEIHDLQVPRQNGFGSHPGLRRKAGKN